MSQTKPITTLKPKNPVNPPNIQEQIQARAVQLFEERGRRHGHDLDDWLKAENEIARKTRSAVA